MAENDLLVIEAKQISVVELSEIYDLSKFDCGDQDINEFIKTEALTYQKESIANTFLFIYQD